MKSLSSNCINVAIFTFLFLAGCLHGEVTEPKYASQEREVSLAGVQHLFVDGKKVGVYFNDGDTFRILEGKNADARVRVYGINTLESYGPVHSWGTWRPYELYNIAKDATYEARSGEWHCRLIGHKDTYGRLLAKCDDLAVSLIQKGLAHVMNVTSQAGDGNYLMEQEMAVNQELGMWAKGAPSYIVTSLHSIVENDKNSGAYDRLVSVADGHSEPKNHNRAYENCQNVCEAPQSDDVYDQIGGKDLSCMLYVDFQHRYGKERASCLYQK